MIKVDVSKPVYVHKCTSCKAKINDDDPKINDFYEKHKGNHFVVKSLLRRLIKI